MRWLRENSLSVAMFGAFLVFLFLQSVTGWHVHNEELTQFHHDPQGYLAYLGTGHFAEAVFENWESEFLQMGAYVLLTAFLLQKGSPESKPLDASPSPGRPGGGWRRRLYENSLSTVLLLFFVLSFLGHLLGGTAEFNEQQMLESGAPPIGAWEFLGTSDFWFQSMQNWQSEFLAVGCLVVLSIVLRQKDSPQSKPVDAAHAGAG
jgi:hypothetical protein